MAADFEVLLSEGISPWVLAEVELANAFISPPFLYRMHHDMIHMKTQYDTGADQISRNCFRDLRRLYVTKHLVDRFVLEGN